MVTNEILEIYFSLNHKLLPIRKHGKNHGKAPIHLDWVKKVYSKRVIKNYAKKGYNIGFQIGKSDLIIDVDPRNGGNDSLKKLLTDCNLTFEFVKENYLIVKTGGGGYHVYCRAPHGFTAHETLKEYPGLEYKRYGRQVVVPGSIHPETGREYKFLNNAYSKPAKLAPLKILSLIKYTQAENQPQSIVSEISNDDLKLILNQIPVDEFRDNESWFALMAASHNATSGKGLNEFLEWSIADPEYSDHARLIESRWKSLSDKPHAITANTLFQQFEKHAPKEFRKFIQEEAIAEFSLVNKPKIKIKSKSQNKKKKKQTLKNLLNNVADFIIKKKFNSGKYIMHAKNQRFWFYNDTYWCVLEDNILSKIIYEIIEERKIDKITNIAAAIDQIKKILIAKTAVDKDFLYYRKEMQSIINTKNKEIWIDEKTTEIDIRKHSYDSYLISCLNTEYDENSECPLFLQTLEEIFCKEKNPKQMIDFLFELFGYIIQPKKNLPIWVLFHGPTAANGKTVCLKVLSSLCGDAVTSCPLDDIKTNFGRNLLLGKLALIDDDLKNNMLLPDSLLKVISENKSITTDVKFGSPITFTNYTTLVMASNSWPRTSDLSNGTRRRGIIIPFRRHFSEEEMDFDRGNKIVKSELSGILNKCLEGLQRLRNRGYFEFPESCEKTKNKWLTESNPFNLFLSEYYKIYENWDEIGWRKYKKSKIKLSEIWGDYSDFAIENGLKNKMTKASLRKALEQKQVKIYKIYDGRYFALGIERKKKEND